MHALDSAWTTVRQEFDAGQRNAALAARLSLLHDLNQLLRRLRRYESEADWASTTLDAAARFASQVALFAVRADKLVLLGERDLPVAPGLEIARQAGAAFANAISTNDTVVALRTSAEVGDALASATPTDRACIMPIANRDRVVSVLFAVSGPAENNVDALELVTGLASAVLERSSNANLHAQIQPAPSGAPVAPVNRTALPAWASLGEEQRSQHIRAQRFSRVKVAEMQLYRPEACRQGREQNNLYLFLRSEIDAAREAYRRLFMTAPTMVDYLHLELVKTAAAGDELKLGAEYPGPLY
ncbi:MAG TPA: hypothetical protein VHZ07_10315 [Bryobacteraceae bacterium]|jgi:hypothetical protein|nr:hypothetical protein [Bryobacteraceae bacterium]